MPVAVDPAWPCGRCELCLRGDPNLCLDLHFAGVYPDGGALCQYMIVPGSACFPIRPGTDPAEGALLETLGIALHAVDLGKARVGDSMAILGAGPIGLHILQVAKLSGANPIFVTDKFGWRLTMAGRFGGVPINCDDLEPVRAVLEATAGRGVDIAIEAAWADKSVQQAAEMARNGGRLVLVGISGDDCLTLKHSTCRRKGLTIRLARRMKHVYPRAIALLEARKVVLMGMVSHRFKLEDTPGAFEMNAAYRDGVVKAVIDIA
jgi:L-iditol 2-dehydrogenase